MQFKEAVRVHFDWYGKCRTCKFWCSDNGRQVFDQKGWRCDCESSVLYNKETWWDGHCEKWETFYLDAAKEAIKQDEMTMMKRPVGDFFK